VLDSISDRIKKVQDCINSACVRVGRDPEQVNLVAVSKYSTAEEIEAAAASGLKIFGENRVQDLLTKYDMVKAPVDWHLIGHLQRNKVHYLAGKVKMIHSVDSLKLAQELNRSALSLGHTWRILIQVNIAEEETKFGLQAGELPGLLDQLRGMSGLEVCGLMTMAPYFENLELVRPVFRDLRQLQEKMKAERPWFDLSQLSMGMSNDFEVAVEEGATLVRVGSALFK